MRKLRGGRWARCIVGMYGEWGLMSEMMAAAEAEAAIAGDAAMREGLAIPTFKEMMLPVLRALRDMGGSGVNGDIDDRVADLLNLTDEQRTVLHANSNNTEIAYRCGWARSYLKKAGYISNTSRGLWMLTAKGQAAQAIDEDEIARTVRSEKADRRASAASSTKEQPSGETAIDLVESISEECSFEQTDWKQRLSDILVNMDPSAFERLFAAVLNEYGFEDVEVVGGSSDGGIDGCGYVRLQGLLTEPVVFQCKRYAPHRAIGPNLIREFRGAMQSRARKGLFVTTSRFTEEARREARRNDFPIDLVDGSALADILMERKMGIYEVVDYAIDESYFESV